MNTDTQYTETLVQNLQDAGCTQGTIDAFMQSYDTNDSVNQTSILAEQRIELLSKIHKEQHKLECLDYLLFQLKKRYK